MSWSVSAVGKPAAVAAKLEKDFNNIHCAEPEETIKNSVAAAVAAGLKAFPPTMAVHVEATGSQRTTNPMLPEEKLNELSVKLGPLFGFVE